MQHSLDVVNVSDEIGCSMLRQADPKCQYKPSNPPKVKSANYQNFQQIRLQRESQQNLHDFPGWFQENIPPTLFETGFIFGATFGKSIAMAVLVRWLQACD